MIVEVVCAGPDVFRWMHVQTVWPDRMASWCLITTIEYEQSKKGIVGIGFGCGMHLSPAPERATPLDHKECFVEPRGEPCRGCTDYIKSKMIDEHVQSL